MYDIGYLAWSSAFAILFPYLIRVWFDTKIKYKPIYFFQSTFFYSLALVIKLYEPNVFIAVYIIEIEDRARASEKEREREKKRINKWMNARFEQIASVCKHSHDCFVWLCVWFVSTHSSDSLKAEGARISFVVVVVATHVDWARRIVL